MSTLCTLLKLAKWILAKFFFARFWSTQPCQEPIINPKWTTFVNMLCNGHQHKSPTKVKYVRANIKKDGFCNTSANFVHMVEPIPMELKALNGKQPCMGKACHEDIGTTYFIIIRSTFSLPLGLANVIKHPFYHWWRMLMTDLHYA